MRKILGLITGNPFMGIVTGFFVTAIIQSSSATTVMVVSFVNAGLMTLTQAIGVIFGANIGTTATAWIVSLIGFKFDLSVFYVPLFGLGYILTFIKKWKKQGLGEAIMGFAILFLGLELLTNAIPPITEQHVAFLLKYTENGFLGILIGLAVSILGTVILHSSSAFTAIILTMAYKGLLTWEFSAVMVLGSNIGTTIDAVLASIGTKVNARRTALVHVLFNVIGTFIALIFIKPLLLFVDWITPGTVQDQITNHIAMLHTVFNVFSALLFLPFIKQLAHLTEKIIKPRKDETPDVYRLDFTQTGIKENSESYIIRAEKEISDMTDLVIRMFDRITESLESADKTLIADHMEGLAQKEDYADQMQEGLSKFLVSCSQLPLPESTRENVSLMLRIVDDLESMTDDCYSVALLLKRSTDKKMVFEQEDMDRLVPYVTLVQQFLIFIKTHINRHLDEEQTIIAQDLEDQIDKFRKNLKKIARKRLEDGADVKTELLYIDLVRNIEKIGDHAFSISASLAQTK